MTKMGWVYIALTLMFGAAPLAGQAPWKSSYFPYVLGDPTSGTMLVGHFQYARQAPYLVSDTGAPNRIDYDGILTVEGGASAQGSRFGAVRFRAPGLIPGWRIVAGLRAQREARFGYYGVFSATPAVPSGGETGDSLYFNRVHRSRYGANVEVSRHLAGPAYFALAGGITQSRYSPLPGASRFRDEHGLELSDWDATLRATLVVDTRDNEFVPTRGVFIEGGAYVGTGGSQAITDAVSPKTSYEGVFGQVRAFASPREGTVFAARIGGRTLSTSAPFDARYTLPGWENESTVLGGAESHRSFIRGRFAGRTVLLGSFEIRHDLLPLGDLGAITLVGFTDAGSASDDGAGRLTIGGGGGIALRILRSGIVTLNFAGGKDGFIFSMGTGWAF